MGRSWGSRWPQDGTKTAQDSPKTTPETPRDGPRGQGLPQARNRAEPAGPGEPLGGGYGGGIPPSLEVIQGAPRIPPAAPASMVIGSKRLHVFVLCEVAGLSIKKLILRANSIVDGFNVSGAAFGFKGLDQGFETYQILK